MDPVIENLIFRIGYKRWAMGSLIICEKVCERPKNAVASWYSPDGNLYILRKRNEGDALVSISLKEDSDPYRIHHAGTSAAVWQFENIFCKVKSWVPKVELESNIINYAKPKITVPIPEIIYTWIDREWNRSFLIPKSVEGITLQHAWQL